MDLDALEKELRVSGDTLVILSEEFHALSLSLPLSPEEVVITEHLASPASTDKLLALKVLNRTELLMVIYYLSIIELIKLRDPSIHQAQAKAAPPFPEACVDPGPAVGNVDVLGQLHSDYVKQFSKARSAAHDAVGTLSAELMDRFRNIQSLNYYEILGLDPKFYDDTKARRAYVEITRKFHPSNFCDAEGEAARLADILLAKSNDAYSTLSNPALKNEYDTSLRSAEERKKIKTSRSGGAELEFQKGVFFLKKSDFKNALESLKRAVETSGEEADYLAAYGWALYNDPGQPKEVREAMAKRYLRKAVVVNAACSRAMIHLATIARLEGHIEEAWMLIDEASRLGKELELLEAERSELRLMPRPQAITSTTSRPAATPPVPSVTTAARPANAPAPDEKKPSGIFSALLGKKKPKG
jgi:curved DNA-binding protein CbpA